MNYLAKRRLREAHRPHWSEAGAWLCLLAALAVSQGLLYFALTRGSGWLLPPLVLLAAHLMHAHLIAFHEAAHGTLCPNRTLNDAAGLFVGALSFMSLTLYQSAHHTHHAHLGTERDEELWPFVDPAAPRWVRRLAAGLELVGGLVYTPLLFLRSFLRRRSPVPAGVRRRIWVELALAACLWAALLAAVAWRGVWELWVVLYLAPAYLAGVMQSVRKFTEHLGLTGPDVPGTTRSVVPRGPLGRLLAWTMFQESYHGVHHRYARLPGKRLPEFASVLTPRGPGDVPPFPTYRRAVWEMLRSLGDPRIGTQWCAPDSSPGEPGALAPRGSASRVGSPVPSGG